ncbi:hypothetical protein [Streptomyces sp. NPDC088757]|uniref:hypothetical protein n=1 Tax=Streptomyces sp. NPDC088757 TaxID=3365889 RepID=UPI00380C971B
MRTKRRAGTTAGAVVAVLAVAGAVLWGTGNGGDGGGPRPLTADEAQRMALARFHTYRQSPSQVTVRAAAGGGTSVVHAVVDHRLHRAVGWYETDGSTGPARSRLLAWDSGELAVAPATAPPSSLAQAARQAAGKERDGWTRRGFGASALDTALRLTLSLAADRPDNAQLLAQSGPLRLGGERIDGRSFDVVSGPRPLPQASPARTTDGTGGQSPLTYWIGDGGALRRVRGELGAGRTFTVDLTAAPPRITVPAAPWERTGASGP